MRTEVTGPALQDLFAEIARLRDELVPEQELSEAKRSMVAVFALSLESPERVLDLHVTRWRYRLPTDYWDRYAERVMSIGPDVIQRMARRYLSADRLQIVAVGDPARVADTLKKLGDVQTYDIEGKAVVGGWEMLVGGSWFVVGGLNFRSTTNYDPQTTDHQSLTTDYNHQPPTTNQPRALPRALPGALPLISRQLARAGVGRALGWFAQRFLGALRAPIATAADTPGRSVHRV